MSFSPLPLPLDGKVQVTGIIPEKVYVFKSALFPLRISFSCLDGSEYQVKSINFNNQIIFKTGDDLRQDQLVIQIITLMDKLLRKENLDLKLVPYKVLATDVNAGLVQYIPSLPIASILSEYNGSIASYLSQESKDEFLPTSPSISETIMETYIKSIGTFTTIKISWILCNYLFTWSWRSSFG